MQHLDLCSDDRRWSLHRYPPLHGDLPHRDRRQRAALPVRRVVRRVPALVRRVMQNFVLPKSVHSLNYSWKRTLAKIEVS